MFLQLTTLVYAATFEITDKEVLRNELLPNLLVFRLQDDKDSNNQYHNGYEVVIIADLRHLIGGLYKATLLSDYEMELVLPTTPASFLEDYSTLQRAMVGWDTLNAAAVKAHETCRAGIMNDSDRKTLKILIRFRTGEKLTNVLYSPESVPYGEIEPAPTPYETSHVWKGRNWKHTEVWLAFKVSRVEGTARFVAPDASSIISNRAAQRLHTAAQQGMSLADTTMSG